MTETKKSILILSYFFPPHMAIGGKRFYFLSALLHEHYHIHVLTLHERCYVEKDLSLPVNVAVDSVPAFPVFPPPTRSRKLLDTLFWYLWIRFLCLFDPFVGWLFPGFVRGLTMIKKHHIDLIIATGPPFCAMIIAWLLHKWTKKPYILDYRDPWAGYAKGLEVKPFGKCINTLLEQKVIYKAAAIVVVTPLMRELLLEKFSIPPDAPFEVITNGFQEPTTDAPLRLETDKYVILYAGTFYGQRRISLLLEPLTFLIQQGELAGDAFRIHVFGTLGRDDRAAVAAAGLAEQIVEHHFVEHAVLLRYMKGADLLFLPSGADVPYAIPGKFYEYLSVQRPILAVGLPDSPLEKIVHETGCGEFAAINNSRAIAEGIKKILFNPSHYTFAGAANYTWKKKSEEYNTIIQTVLACQQDKCA